MLTQSRDIMLPLGWVPGPEFRLKNIQGGDPLFYMELFEGLPHIQIPQRNILWGELHHIASQLSSSLPTGLQ